MRLMPHLRSIFKIVDSENINVGRHPKPSNHTLPSLKAPVLVFLQEFREIHGAVGAATVLTKSLSKPGTSAAQADIFWFEELPWTGY